MTRIIILCCSVNSWGFETDSSSWQSIENSAISMDWELFSSEIWSGLVFSGHSGIDWQLPWRSEILADRENPRLFFSRLDFCVILDMEFEFCLLFNLFKEWFINLENPGWCLSKCRFSSMWTFHVADDLNGGSAAWHRHRHCMREAAVGICRLKCFCRCFCWTFKANPDPRIPAGRAKKDMAKTEKQEATILPIQVWGTVSPYPIVVTVITPHQSASA